MIEYDETQLFRIIFRLHGSVFWKAGTFAIPSGILGVVFRIVEEEYPDIWVYSGLPSGFDKSQIWRITTLVLGILLSMRTNRAVARFWEGTGLLHQMRGEWFDSLSCLTAFSASAKRSKPDEVREFRHTMVRLMSLCHASGLEEISEEACEPLMTIDTFGLSDQTIEQLKRCKAKYGFNRVEVILHMLQTLITQALNDGVLQIAPPILSRVYQTLSRGLVNLLNAKKIVDTRFPFPYAQIISALLMMHIIITPFMVSAFVPNKAWCGFFSFVPVFGMFCLLLVAIELENPFGDDVNDLPLHFFQEEMNRCLLLLLEDNVDLIPCLHQDRAAVNFRSLLATMQVEKQYFQSDDGSVSTYSKGLLSSLLGTSHEGVKPAFRRSLSRSIQIGRKTQGLSPANSISNTSDLNDSWTKRLSVLSEASSAKMSVTMGVQAKWDPSRDVALSRDLALGNRASDSTSGVLSNTSPRPFQSSPLSQTASDDVFPAIKVNSLPRIGEEVEREKRLSDSEKGGESTPFWTTHISNAMSHTMEQIDRMEAHLAKMVSRMESRHAKNTVEPGSPPRPANVDDKEVKRKANKHKDTRGLARDKTTDIPREMGIDASSIRRTSHGLCCGLYGQATPEQLLVVPAAAHHRQQVYPVSTGGPSPGDLLDSNRSSQQST